MKTIVRNFLAGICLALATTAAQAEPETLDMMVLYTADALQHPNGRDMDARIVAAVEWTNQAFRNSRINARVRLVHTAQVGRAYQGNLQNQHLGQLRQDAEVARLRDEHGADFVALIGPSNAWCGLGYVPQGNPATGQLHHGAGDWAYNLVSISCGHATFAHELGHNMSLGHSNAQNSHGGVWPWARGHGEHGRFVTIMGYTSAFSTFNRLQYFSNPELTECEGSRCGVDRNHAQGADAARNVNLLASQMADFKPTRHPIDGGGGDDGDDDGGDGEHSEWQRLVSGTDVCMAVADGHTEVGTQINPARCSVGDNQKWQLDDRQRLRPKHAPQLCLSIGGRPYNGATANLDHCRDHASQKWVLSGELMRNQANRNQVLDVFQQQGRIGTWAAHGGENQQWGWDEVDDGGSRELCDKPHLADNLIDEGDFNGLSSWSRYRDASRLEQVAQERDCGLDNRLQVTDRDYWFSGPTQDIADAIRDGAAFNFSLLARLAGDSGQRDTLRVAVRLVDDSGVRWHTLLANSITNSNFDRLEAQFAPDIQGHLTEATLLVYGPSAGRDFLIDEVLLETVEERGPQYLLLSDFESDVDGWSDAYGALAERSGEEAADGRNSLKVTHRRLWYAGTQRDVRGLIEPNQRYRLNFDVLTEGTNRSAQRVDAQLLIRDGHSARWIRVIDQPVSIGQWQPVSGELELNGINGDLEQVVLYVFGPEPATEFYIDNVTLEALD